MRISKKICAILALWAAFLGSRGLEAEVLRFQYVPESKFRAVAQVNETVVQTYGRQQAVQQSELRYKISYTITDVRDGTGDLEGIFQIANRSSGDAGVYQWSEEHPTAYSRDAYGRMNVPDGYSFPVVRGVPMFPEGDIAVGATWVGVGEEVHDFRESGSDLGIVRFPINVAYQYLGKKLYKGKMLHAIDATYQIYHRFPASRGFAPEQISGFSAQHLFWDNDKGYLAAYTEEFELVMQLNDGTSWLFQGDASAEVVQVEEMEKEKVAEDIRNSLKEDMVEDSEVRVDDQGITIALHNIRFMPDSSRFVPGEEEKIRAVAEILKRYPDRDVLITGHTALAGTASGRERLSLERARVSARALIELGARREDQIVIRGMGAREPVAENSNEAGRRLNRRVEITLLEN